MGLVVPAVLPYSKKELEEKLEFFSHIPSVSRIQIDVVDGRFVSPASWPYTAPEELHDMVERVDMLPHLHQIEYEVDLMCIDADRIAESFLTLGASRLTFHAESSIDLPRLFASVRRRYGTGDFSSIVSLGLAINIASDFGLIEQSLGEVEYVQFMGIAQIGRQGQPFDGRVLEKIRVFRIRHPAIPMQVDGGVSLENAGKLITLGVSNLVVGSAIMRAGNPAAVIEEFEKLKSSYGV